MAIQSLTHAWIVFSNYSFSKVKNKLMLTIRFRFIVILVMCCISKVVYPQGSYFSDSATQKTEVPDSTAKLQLRKIIITGNKKTRKE